MAELDAKAMSEFRIELRVPGTIFLKRGKSFSHSCVAIIITSGFNFKNKMLK
jgi:hypothetical protein